MSGHRRAYWTVLLIVFVQFSGTMMVVPILPLYAKERFAVSSTVIAFLISIFFGAQFLAGPLLGRWSDRYGRLRVLLISQFGTAVSFALIAVAGSVELLFFARILDGITGGNLIVAQAYMTDITPPNKHAEALGKVWGAMGLGLVLGPLLGSTLAAFFGATIPFLLAALVAFLTVPVIHFTMSETVLPSGKLDAAAQARSKISSGEVLRNLPLFFILTVTFCTTINLGLMLSTFALYGEAVMFAGFPVAQITLGIGVVYMSFGVGQVVTQWWILPWLLRRTAVGRLAFGGLIGRGIGVMVMATMRSGTGFLFAPISGIFSALGVGTMAPALQAMATRSERDEVRGAILGWVQSAGSLATIFGTAFAGALFDAHPRLPFYVSAVIFAAMLAPSYYLMRWSDRQERKVGLRARPASSQA
ncbi:MAG: MFS transporter [Chloroflexi bacterium]|nr:MFS transporter [Chloroflexota bacterium]MCY4105706.1 MFS transporter [Chloroflexota bacterium]